MPTSKTHVLVAVGLPLAILTLVLSREPGFIAGAQSQPSQNLTIRQDDAAGTIAVYRSGTRQPILTQHAAPDARPYLHPIAAPDGRGVLTEYSPGHHPHQTGLYWGFTRVNGRDYFHNRLGDYWRRVSVSVTRGTRDRPDEDVRWQTVYDLLDAAGQPVLTETQRWSVRERQGRFILDLEWRGDARTDVVIGRYDYGGLFLRMPWRQGIAGEVVNAARQRNARAEGQRAMWIDVGMQVEGRNDLAHVAIFDHPANTGYPQQWRVDSQLGVGSARQREADFTLAKGHTEILRHQLVLYTGALNDVELTSLWSDFSGSRGVAPTSALWSIAQREGREAPRLTADEAVRAMTLANGYTVNAWAAEPVVVQPMAFTWDDRGRLWVAENLDYETRGRGFSNDGTSRIVILEDTDRDGVSDRRTVFMEGIIFPSALAVGFGGVFVGAPPNLLFVPDRNGDDKADLADIEVRLTGWGIQDRHEVMNSFHWGPDGWLYGLQGYATNSNVRKPVGKGRIFTRQDPFPANILAGEGVRINGGVWRYHPTRDLFEVVAHGFSNPWGIDHDAKGQLLITACVIPHLWHVVPGGIYQRQGGQHFNPYVYADIQTIADHRHRSAHGGARVYQSDAFPASERGRVFMANIHEHAVLSDVLERRGSSFTARHGDEVLMANNAHWIGFSLEVGPDGAVYVLDWHDPEICGNNVQHKDTGRIYRISPATSLAQTWDGRYADLGRMTDRQLADLQGSPSDWHARRARVVLQGRAAAGRLAADTQDTLRRMFREHDNPDVRLRAMWTLQITGGWTPEGLVETLRDRDEYVRAWAVQFLTEDRSPAPAALERFVRMAREDRSPVVRLYLASALQRLDPPSRWAIAGPLMRRAEDAGDHNLPTMVWLGIEPLVQADATRALDHASESGIPQLARFIARRLVDANALDPLVATIAREPRTVASLLDGMRDGLAGRSDVATPAGWPAALSRLERSNVRVAGAAAEVARRFGDAETSQRNLATLRSASESTENRRRALVALAAQRRSQLVADLPGLIDVPELRVDAIRAVAAFDNPGLAKLLISRYAGFRPVERAEALQALASRAASGRLLTSAIEAGTVPRRDVPPHIARQLRRVVGTQFTSVWGPVEADTVEDKVLAKYRVLLTDAAIAGANPARGRAVFQQTCGSCHQMYGEGGALGPDLTGSNRTNLDYLLFNVLNPNGDVPDAYRMVVITTRDGRTMSGNVTAETERQVTLRTVVQEAVVINTADIQSREVTPVSMMPTGLLDALTDREVIDLVGYLKIVSPLAAP
jgi:putative membrane-bound dehydrogenase-like protein